ncbi:amidohydrolase [Bradyrhizobium sp. HKCCYLS20291]|uniref:amidohydrolase n=1 Tax=Bradyrhizobium sp. HKCCYLS20291 TaxID=3420766 RepID=UPI003EB8AD29
MSEIKTSADTLFRNGRIYTVDPGRPWASCAAVKAGRFVAVGEESDVEPFVGNDTEVVDLAGRMVMPGIVDIHNHIMMGGQADLYELRFPSSHSISQIAAVVRDAAEKAAPGSWIVGGQFGNDLLQRLNTDAAAAELNAASLGHPVLLRDDSYHNRWASAEALRIAGLTQETENPVDGEIGRDLDSGRLTGLMVEAASGIIERALAKAGHYTAEMDRAAVARSIGVLNSFGVTGFVDAASMQPILAALKGLDDRGELSAWAVCAMPIVEPGFMFGTSGEELFALRDQYRSAHVKPDYAKMFLDGVPGAKTAAFHEPYLTDPVRGCCFRGTTMLTVPELIRWLGKCEKLGLAAKIHCAGDAAVTQALDAIEVVRSFNGPTALIHHIAHASYIAPDDIRRFADLGVAADLSPIIWFPTIFLEAHKAAMGPERAERFWPNRDLKLAGALMAGGSDWPVIPNPDPWHGIEGMVTRRNPAGDFPGQALWPEQALDLATVIEIYTIDAARAAGLGGITGSIEVGKSADLIVLDQLLFEIPADQIAETNVQMTFFEGRKVHERNR